RAAFLAGRRTNSAARIAANHAHVARRHSAGETDRDLGSVRAGCLIASLTRADADPTAHVAADLTDVARVRTAVDADRRGRAQAGLMAAILSGIGADAAARVATHLPRRTRK